MRKRPPAPEAERWQAAAAVAGLVGADKKRPKKSKGVTPGQVRKWRTEAERMREAGDWVEAKPQHLVALYLDLHGWCYGVEASELISGGPLALAATGAAKKLLEREFGGSVTLTVEFIRWVWQREKKREEWRREQGGGNSRISWLTMFQRRHLLTDFRIQLERRMAR